MGDEPFRFEGFPPLEYTNVPDAVFDVLAPILKEGELRVLLYIIRRTFGFKKNADNISLSQLVSGITTKDGRVLDKGTGMHKPAVVRAIHGLQEKGIVLARRNKSAERGHETTTYALRFKGDPWFPKDTRLVSQETQALVSEGNIQETVLQETESNGPRRFPSKAAAHLYKIGLDVGDPEPDQSQERLRQAWRKCRLDAERFINEVHYADNETPYERCKGGKEAMAYFFRVLESKLKASPT